jgi:hypothetical protein
MKTTILVIIASLAVGASFVDLAAARTQPAIIGVSVDGTQTSQFQYLGGNGGVVAMANSQWVSGFVTDTAGLKSIRLATRAAALGAMVRMVASDFFGTVTSVTPTQAIPVGPSFVALAFNVNMVANGTVVIRANMNPGAMIGTVEYNP